MVISRKNLLLLLALIIVGNCDEMSNWGFLPNQNECFLKCQNSGICAFNHNDPSQHKCICFLGEFTGDLCEKPAVVSNELAEVELEEDNDALLANKDNDPYFNPNTNSINDENVEDAEIQQKNQEIPPDMSYETELLLNEKNMKPGVQRSPEAYNAATTPVSNIIHSVTTYDIEKDVELPIETAPSAPEIVAEASPNKEELMLAESPSSSDSHFKIYAIENDDTQITNSNFKQYGNVRKSEVRSYLPTESTTTTQRKYIVRNKENRRTRPYRLPLTTTNAPEYDDYSNDGWMMSSRRRSSSSAMVSSIHITILGCITTIIFNFVAQKMFN